MCVCVYICIYIYPDEALRIDYRLSIKNDAWDFTGGAVVKNPPANAGDMGSSPGLERSHMLWNN